MEPLASIEGVRFGHWTDPRAVTGCTAVLVSKGAVAAVDVRGSAPATHETDLLASWASVQRIHGLLLTGGSAFGLAAVHGVVDALEEKGIGLGFAGSLVPIVPAAAIFDLAIGDGQTRPDRKSGRLAAEAALKSGPDDPLVEGSVGAGTGATVAKIFGRGSARKGGVGAVCHRFPSGATVGAIAVVNALGNIVDPVAGAPVVESRDDAGRCVDEVFFAGSGGPIISAGISSGESTTLVAVVTDLKLSRNECAVIARMAQDGLARTISPAHTPFDGDVVFALASCERCADVPVAVVGHVAARVVAEAILRGVRNAEGRGGVAGARDDGRQLPPTAGN